MGHESRIELRLSVATIVLFGTRGPLLFRVIRGAYSLFETRCTRHAEHSSHLWKNRFRLEGGLRWARLDSRNLSPANYPSLIRQRARLSSKPLGGSTLNCLPPGSSPSYLRRLLNMS